MSGMEFSCFALDFCTTLHSGLGSLQWCGQGSWSPVLLSIWLALLLVTVMMGSSSITIRRSGSTNPVPHTHWPKEIGWSCEWNTFCQRFLSCYYKEWCQPLCLGVVVQDTHQLEQLYCDPVHRLVADCVLMDTDTAVASDRHGNFCVLSCTNIPEGMRSLTYIQRKDGSVFVVPINTLKTEKRLAF